MESQTALTFVDSIIEMQNGPVLSADTNAYLRDVFVRGGSSIAQRLFIGNPSRWTWIKEYHSTSGTERQNLVNGSLNFNQYIWTVENVDVPLSQLERSVTERHRPPVPSFEDDGFVNVQEMGPMSAKGDGISDDTRALQYAVDHYQKVFLPQGLYLLKDTLRLKRDTQLVGVSKSQSRIMPHPEWRPDGETPVVITPDDPDATTTLSHIRITTSMLVEQPGTDGFVPLVWRAGRNSLTRDVVAGSCREEWLPNQFNHNLYKFKFTGSGGGRHFGLLAHQRTTGIESTRGIRIDGTSEPLHIYGFNGAQEPVNMVGEITNASHVRFYRPSHEGGEIVYRIIDSSDVAFYGGRKNGTIASGRGGFEIVDSDDILIEDYMFINTESDDQYALIETYEGVTNQIGDDMHIALFKRGEPAFANLSSRQSAALPPRYLLK
jgi:hypothetical protein